MNCADIFGKDKKTGLKIMKNEKDLLLLFKKLQGININASEISQG